MLVAYNCLALQVSCFCMSEKVIVFVFLCKYYSSAVPPHQSPTKKTSIINKPAPSASSIIQRFNNITQPTIASTHRQRLMARSQSVSAEKTLGTLPPTNPNAPPWVSHWKSEKGIIQVGGGAKNTVSGMIKVHEQQQDAASPRPLQVYRKYVHTFCFLCLSLFIHSLLLCFYLFTLSEVLFFSHFIFLVVKKFLFLKRV